ncbi:hypothetical protein AB1Y20_016004 [Prymnesium parvum]|uniref:Chromo domain-containing protein n=1 Tax=Prymnesium parvum TaxID=97485 RepID=A0AB34IQT2_PRYPA
MPPKRGRPRQTPAAAPAAATAPAPAKRTRPFRTPQTPFEAAEEEPLYEVDYIKNVRYVKGVRQYEVVWEGYGPNDTSWEPMENLVGCAQQIREYERKREAEAMATKEEALRKKQERT